MTSPRRLAGLSLCLCLTSCVAPAFTTSQYKAKIVATAEAAVSSIETVRLSLDLMDRHGLPKGPIDVTVSAQEDIMGSVVGSFSLGQPPNDESIRLRDELLDLLDQAQSSIEDARIALRRGDVNAAVTAIEEAEGISQDLEELETRSSAG